MFQALRLEVLDRFTSIEAFLRQTRRIRGESAQTAKGLVFVQVYAVHEFTVSQVVRIAVEQIIAQSHSYSDLRPSLLSLFLNREISSLRGCAPRKEWEQRLELLSQATSADQVAFQGEIPLPIDGTHFRHSHLKLILRVFGISKRPTVRVRHLYRIDEVVEKRNAISHGRETAAEVGKRFSRADMFKAIRQMRSACLRLVLLFEEHCKIAANSKR